MGCYLKIGLDPLGQVCVVMLTVLIPGLRYFETLGIPFVGVIQQVQDVRAHTSHDLPATLGVSLQAATAIYLVESRSPSHRKSVGLE